MDRSDALSKIASAILTLPQVRPVTVAVNGRIASGKTTFATELAAQLLKEGRPVRHVGVDGFHNPKATRYQQGRASAKGYYEDAYDLDSLKRLLLKPLCEPADSQENVWLVRTASFDLDADEPLKAPIETMSSDEILIVDGSFLLVSKLRSLWDYKIFIDVERATAAERGAARDAATLNGIEEARRLHDQRYQAACDLYLTENNPQKVADVVLDNSAFDKPILSFKQNSV